MPAGNVGNEDAIVLKGVRKDYGPLTVLQPLDLSIRQGEFLTLLGPSGSGKTTLLSLISGGASPTRGTIYLSGRDITAMPPRDRGIGMVFQNYALMPHLTVFQNVAYPLRVRGETDQAIKQKVANALDRVGLRGFEDRKPRQLSGGQQQRVGIARCIVYSPAIIMMDEPLGALDKNLREQMQGEIKRLHRDLGTTLIYVTHDQEEALNMSDRICLMSAGEVAQLGTPDDLYFRPKNRFTAEFIGESNLFDGKLSSGNKVAITGSGVVVTTGVGGNMPDGPICAMIRPEKVRIAAGIQAGALENSISGDVTSVSFIGGLTRVTLISADGIAMTAKTISNPAEARPQVGSKVTFDWSPQDTVLLSA